MTVIAGCAGTAQDSTGADDTASSALHHPDPPNDPVVDAKITDMLAGKFEGRAPDMDQPADIPGDTVAYLPSTLKLRKDGTYVADNHTALETSGTWKITEGKFYSDGFAHAILTLKAKRGSDRVMRGHGTWDMEFGVNIRSANQIRLVATGTMFVDLVRAGHDGD
jgi:hypothetical protein